VIRVIRVVMLAPEVHPYAKTGGLADVLGALPRALARRDVDVTVCMPGYRAALRAAGATTTLARVHAPVSSRMEPVEFLRIADAPIPTVLARADRYFDRAGLYGESGTDYGDNAERFVVFVRAVLEWLRTTDPPPHVLHVHEWQAALAPAFLRLNPELYPELGGLRTVLTIHNLAYQGRFPSWDWHLLNLEARYFTPEFLEFYGQINFLKAGILFADATTTVSPRYAREIQTPEFGEGLDGVLRTRRARLRGILNGIDDEEWDPATDPLLPAHYDARDLAGKSRCKAALQDELHLDRRAEPPLFGLVSRLAEQKGIDLVLDAVPRLLARSDAQLAMLGTGNEHYERSLRELAGRFPGRVGVTIGFAEPLAHRIEAGADAFLMPSRFEPCGLNQLYSLRYGTVPVVRATGGLDDTIDEETGFKFGEYSGQALLESVREAVQAYANRSAWREMIRRGMQKDYSWTASAARYSSLYKSLAAGAV